MTRRRFTDGFDMTMDKHELDILAFMGTPMKQKSGLFIEISRYFTDVQGKIVNKSSVPLALQVEYPIWMFGQFDKMGGYHVGNKITPPVKGTSYLGTFVGGLDMPFLFATGLNEIQDKISIGDLVHVFTDDLNAPTWYVFMIQTCRSASVASVYANAIASEQQKIDIRGVNYFSYTNGNPNLQFTHSMNLTRIDVVGGYVNEPFPPSAYEQVDNKQGYFITIPIKFVVDQYNLLSTYMDFEVDVVNFSLLINKNTNPV